MKKSNLFIILLLVQFPVKGACINSTIDNDAIFNLVNGYITLLQKTINNKSNEYLSEIDLYFNEPISNSHAYDLSNQLEKEFVLAYYSDASNSIDVVEVEASVELAEILSCTYFDNTTSRQYTYVRLPKIMIRKGDKKTSYTHYISIDVTNNKNYSIEAVYPESAETQTRFINPCMKSTLDTKEQMQLGKLIEEKYQEVSVLYSKMAYLEALVLTEEILELNPQYTEATDAKESLLELINSEIISKNISNLLSENKISQAGNTLQIVSKFNLGTATEIKSWQSEINQKESFLKQELNYKKAENYFNSQMYQQALPILIKLRSEGYNSQNLNSMIKVSQEADPQFVQKKLREAYNAAVKSRKNADDTFKTYYKYENSGYLNGDNYKFMCNQMLGSGNKRLLKEMNISPNQAKNLAIKYFYKAKNLGEDVSFIENMIFTKNFNSKRK
ncbi:MAG: hypothetical protein WDZ45_11260 [Flavobacteriaceae bacterium]